MAKLIERSAKKTCKLNPMPTPLVGNCIDSLLPVITKIFNLSLPTGSFSDEWKCVIFNHLLKNGLDLICKNYRPVNTLQHIPKLTERAVYEQVHRHMEMSNIYPLFQSAIELAYRKQNSTEMALLKVMNDILLKLNFSQHVTFM